MKIIKYGLDCYEKTFLYLRYNMRNKKNKGSTKSNVKIIYLGGRYWYYFDKTVEFLCEFGGLPELYHNREPGASHHYITASINCSKSSSNQSHHQINHR